MLPLSPLCRVGDGVRFILEGLAPDAPQPEGPEGHFQEPPQPDDRRDAILVGHGL